MMLFFGRLVQWPHCDGRGRTPRSGFLLGFRLSSRIMMTMLGTVTSRKRKRSSVGRLFGQFLGFLGDAGAAWPRLLSLSLLFGPGFGFCGTTVMVVLARSPGCPGSVGPGSVGFGVPADSVQTTFPMNEHMCVIPWGSPFLPTSFCQCKSLRMRLSSSQLP